jgi:membrane associated rhomboid family serine protease
MAVTAIAGGQWISALAFTTPAFPASFWTLLTYPWVNPPDVLFVVMCWFMIGFGGSVEQHLGRRSTIWLLVGSLLLLPAVLLALQWALGLAGLAAGLRSIEFTVFIAFATLYARAEINLIICRAPAWIVAAIFVAIGVLQGIMARSPQMVASVLAPAAMGYFWVKQQTGRLKFKMPAFFKRKPMRGAPPQEIDLDVPMAHRYQRPISDEEQINAILDKISSQGMQSLTADEKGVLERRSRIEQHRKKR